MRLIGTQAHGIRLPIISHGDDLSSIVVKNVLEASEQGNIDLRNGDVIGITEAIVAKSQGNLASVDDIAADIKDKFQDNAVGVVFPILSRNRFLNILKGISRGAKKVYVLLQYPSDEVGNPIMDIDSLDEVTDKLKDGFMSASEFKNIVKDFSHPFTNIDYISLYEEVGDNIEIYLSKDSRDILKLTKNILVTEIHNRFITKKRLIAAGAEIVYTLSDILTSPVKGMGYNEKYGVLGSNIHTQDMLKLFPNPNSAMEVVNAVQKGILEKTGKQVEVLVYGDGAFKDPICGIWELADPVVSPAYTEKLGGQPNEIKLKYVAENNFSGLQAEEKQEAIINLIKEKNQRNSYNEGTTPRKYADLLGSLCDLMSGSGDKGTPVILIQGYFDDYSTQ